MKPTPSTTAGTDSSDCHAPMNHHILTAASLLLITTHASPSMAAVTITIAQQGPDVIARAIGTLDLPPSSNEAHCGGVPGLIQDGAIAPGIGAICLGSGSGYTYSISGPSTFGTGLGRYADSSDGGLFGLNSSLGILASKGTIIDSTSTWRNTSISDLGITPGDLGTWQLGHPGEGTITARAEVPGPLGFLGAAGLWSWSRRLRARVRAGQ